MSRWQKVREALGGIGGIMIGGMAFLLWGSLALGGLALVVYLFFTATGFDRFGG